MEKGCCNNAIERGGSRLTAEVELVVVQGGGQPYASSLGDLDLTGLRPTHYLVAGHAFVPFPRSFGSTDLTSPVKRGRTMVAVSNIVRTWICIWILCIYRASPMISS